MTHPAFTLTRAAVRELDRRAIADYGVPGVVLMENAGRGCAELLMHLNPEKRPTVILCGPGNNGGDGFVIARHLDNRGWPAEAFAVCDLGKLAGDAAVMSFVVMESFGDRLHGPGFHPADMPRLTEHLREAICEPCWIIDALFGTGLTRGLAAPYDEIVAQVNASGNPVLAVDLPSGLDCDTGEPLGPTVRATHTATFVAPKAGFANPRSRDWTGTVHVVDIGAPRRLVDEFRRG